MTPHLFWNVALASAAVSDFVCRSLKSQWSSREPWNEYSRKTPFGFDSAQPRNTWFALTSACRR